MFWRKKNSNTKQTRLAFLAILILFTTLLVGISFQFLSSLTKPISLNLSQKFNWDGNSSLNFLIATKDELKSSSKGVQDSENQNYGEISLLSLHPITKKVVVLHMSDQIHLNVPKEFGYWNLGSIYRLGQEEKPPVGASLLKLSISKLVGLPVDAVIITKNKKYVKEPEELIKKIRQNPISIIGFLSDIETNLTPIEATKLFWYLSQVRSDKIQSLNLEDTALTESKLLPDSTRVLGVDNLRLDTFIRDYMADENFQDDGFSVAIFNATDRAGLAQEAARIVTNLGGNVVLTMSSSEKQEKTKVFIKDRDGQKISESKSAKRLTQIFAPDCLTQVCEVKDPKILNSRAQINIVLGEEYFKLWYSRE